jgi:group I intron endonuclease
MKIIKPIIYLMYNKKNGKIYVGKTIDQQRRWNEYLPPFYNKYPIQYAILKHGIENFEMIVVDELEKEDQLNEAEIFWISYYRNLGAILYNATEGGDGISGYKHTDETRKLMSEQRLEKIASGEIIPAKHTEEWKENRRQAMLGHTINVGRKHKPDCGHCKLLKIRNKTNNPSKNGMNKEAKQKMSNAKLGSKNNNSILTEEKVIELRKLANEGVKTKDLAIKFDISRTTVRGIKNGRSWSWVK